MSYILEALRKSERERQTGQVPALPALLSDRPPPRWQGILWLLLLLLLVLNGAGLGYLWLNGWGKNPSPVLSTSPKPVHPIVEPTVGKTASADVGPHTTITLTDVPPVTDPPPQAAKPVPAAKSPLPQRSGAKAGTAVSLLPAPPSGRAAKPTVTVARIDRITEKETLPQKTPEPAFVPRIPDTEMEVQEPEHEPAEQSAIPWMSALPADFQQRLPPIKINIFAYSKVPAERFAIIDMRKYLVGDRIPGGALLLEIRADSLVLELDGTRFRVPRP